jgi:hypothetical protein
VGVIVTRGSSLQGALPSLVRRWADQNGVDDHAGLEQLNVAQTARQKRDVMKRVQRTLKPVPFREAWTGQFVSDKFGVATTHWAKLEARVHRGVGNPCPLLLIGIPDSTVTFGEDPQAVAALLEEGAETMGDPPLASG